MKRQFYLYFYTAVRQFESIVPNVDKNLKLWYCCNNLKLGKRTFLNLLSYFRLPVPHICYDVNVYNVHLKFNNKIEFYSLANAEFRSDSSINWFPNRLKYILCKGTIYRIFVITISSFIKEYLSFLYWLRLRCICYK
jgi:hypothetical protein